MTKPTQKPQPTQEDMSPQCDTTECRQPTITIRNITIAQHIKERLAARLQRHMQTKVQETE